MFLCIIIQPWYYTVEYDECRAIPFCSSDPANKAASNKNVPVCGGDYVQQFSYDIFIAEEGVLLVRCCRETVKGCDSTTSHCMPPHTQTRKHCPPPPPSPHISHFRRSCFLAAAFSFIWCSSASAASSRSTCRNKPTCNNQSAKNQQQSTSNQQQPTDSNQQAR